MHTSTSVLDRRLPQTGRWLIALLAALVVAMTAARAAHAAAPDCSGPATARAFDLWAKTGTLTMADGAVIPVWGYAAADADPAQVPGPTLMACEGDSVTITLHNGLAEDTSLAVHGQAGFAADMTGVGPGLDNSAAPYAFTAHAGTFVYQAGLTVNGPKQAAMGLYGALVVYPSGAGGQAYVATTNNPDTAYDSEALLVLGEIDPALNADPANFDMHDYAPKYWLINGKSYPQTDAIPAPTGQKLLVRYANAGFLEHSMGLLGLDQTIIADNGFLSPYAHGAVAETVPPAGTMDAIVTPLADGQYALYDGNQHIDNNGAALGGMMTFINAVTAGPPPVDQPPTVNAGLDQTITLPAGAALDGTVTDDSLSPLTTQWTMTSGPGTVTFGDASLVDTTADFSVDGTYVLRLTATDGTGPVSDEVTITVNPAPAPVAASFAVSCTTPALTTDPVDCTVTAVDGAGGTGNTVTGYMGTVHFTSSDGGATLPADYTFVAGDAGTKVFTGLAFATSGSQTVTVTDVADTTINGTTTVAVP